MLDVNQNIDLARGKIAPTYARILVPTFFGMLSTALFLLTDGIFVGHGIGSDALAAVNIVQPVFTVATAIGMMFAVGASVVAAVDMSHGENDAAGMAVTRAFSAVLFLGVILGVVLYLFPNQILVLLGSSDVLMPLCREYYLWFIPTVLFTMLQLCGQFVIRLDGSPVFSSLMEIVPAVVNIFLDWLFIFPMDMGLAGAALATSIGGIVGVGMAAWYMVFKAEKLSFTGLKTAFLESKEAFGSIAHMAGLGASAFLGEFAVSVQVLAGNYMFMKVLGEDGVAAYSVTCYLVPIFFMACMAMSQSAQPLISFNYGAGKMDRVWETFRISTVLAAVFGLAVTLIFIIFPDAMVAVFINRASPAFRMCSEGLPYYSLGFVFMNCCVSVVGFFQSIERSRTATVLTLLRGMVFPVAAIVGLPAILGSLGLWLSMPVSETVSLLFIALPAMVKYGRGEYEPENK